MANTNSLSLVSASNQWAVAADSASLSITGDMTLQGWVKRASIGAVMTLISKWNTSGNQRAYELRFQTDNTLEFRISVDGTNQTSKSTTDVITSTSTWNHIAIVYTASSGAYAFYINGVASQSGTGMNTSIVDSTARFGVGGEDAGTDTPTNPFNGLVDDVRVYNIARTSGAIAGDYLQEISSFTNVKGYYKLNNDYTDASGNSNNLTAKNSPTFSTDVPFGAATATSSGFFAMIR